MDDCKSLINPAVVRVVAGSLSSGRPLKVVKSDQMCSSSSAVAVTLIALPMKTLSGPQTGEPAR